MAKHDDPIRYKRISEIIYADVYDDEEVAMSWYYYFADNFEFPADAVAMLKVRGGKEVATPVQVIGLEDAESNDLRLEVCLKDSDKVLAIAPNRILSISTTAANLEILNDWLFMHDFDLI